jgi:hypothetical protein
MRRRAAALSVLALAGLVALAACQPYVDRSTIPTGSPGSGAVRVRATTEQPSPSGDGIGAFRTVCDFSHMNFDDPIVYPGQPDMSHLHAYFGNTDADAHSTQHSLATSGNSTCRGGIVNRTAYWVPALIDTRDGSVVTPEPLNAYYKTGYNGIEPSEINAMPAGLRMIAGNSKATGPQPGFVHWKCESTGAVHTPSVPDCATGDSVVMVVDFPQCWNGRDLDAADHKSHMAYPSGGRCPASHPVAIPVITYNVSYPVTAGSDPGSWRLASDGYDRALPGGYSIHADWFDGWDVGIKNAFIEHCDRAAVDCHSHLLGDGRAIY